MRLSHATGTIFCAGALLIGRIGVGHASDLPMVRTITAQQLRSAVREATNHVVLLHFWATWCRPCREEFPALVRLVKTYPTPFFRLILVSADAEEDLAEAAEYLARQGLQEPSYLALRLNDVFIKSVSSEWSGALPASFFFVPGRGLAKWWEGAHAYETYAETVEALIREQGGMLR